MIGLNGFLINRLDLFVKAFQEWTKAKDIAIRKGHVDIVEAISCREILLRKRANVI